jgi:hypothetical protein
MAYIDKIYGNRHQWHQLHAFLVQTNVNALKYLYKQPEENSGDENPLSNFPDEINQFLWEKCPLDFVRNRLKEQYSKFKKIDV